MTEQKQKTILISISKDIIRRNVMETDFWPTVRDANRDARFIILAPAGLEDVFEKAYGADNVVIESTKKEATSFWLKVVFFLVRNGIRSHGTTLYRWRGLTMGQASWPLTLVKATISNTLARFTWYKRLVRKMFAGLSLKWVEELLDQYQPDLVFTPSLIDFEIDAMVGVVAKRRGIRVVGMVRSWDNLSIHGLLPFVPDRFLLQNKWLVESAETLQSLNMDKIPHAVVGLPHYDLYKDPTQYIKPREEFFRGMGLDPNKKMILFGGFDFHFSEDSILKWMDEAITDGRISGPVQILFRPHPRTPFKMEEYHVEERKNVVLNAAFLDKKKAFSDTETFINLVYHCDVIVIAASTMAIDGAVFDKPVICLNFDDPEKNVPHWKQAGRFYDSFDHYEHLISRGGVNLVTSLDQLIEGINEYMADPTKDALGRKQVLETLVEPFDGKSGERLGTILNEEIAACG